MVATTTSFPDIQNNWARLLIEGLAGRGIVSGFPDRTFRPQEAMTRAQFAAILGKAFQQPWKRRYIPFVDVPSTHWGAAAIQKAYETGFLSGYPDRYFHPEEKITRVQVLTSLVSGLEIIADRTSNLKESLLAFYEDTSEIPGYAIEKIAAATDVGLVVNYPSIKLLKPLQIATRADVAAFIYQALVHLGKVPAIQSEYIVVPYKTIRVSHRREFRGVWVVTGWNIDWPSKRGLPVERQKAELIEILDRIQSLNLNALIFQVRSEGDAFYASQIEPWSGWLTGIQGKPPQPFYDPLEFIIAESHKRNIELHAWFNPYRAKTISEPSLNVRPHIAVTHPEVVDKFGTDLWMNPGAEIIRDWTYNVILDVVRRYDVDGIHLDDYFYPYPIEGEEFPDATIYAAYRANGGKLSLADWRRENIDRMIQRLAEGIKTEKPYVKFGISPFGIYRPGQPPGIRGLDAYDKLYADAKKWLELGWIDYLSPQLYWRIDPPAQSYPVLLKWWTENNPKRRHIYPGNKLDKLDGTNWPISEYERQIEITRNLAPQLVLGNIFYGQKILKENRLGISDTFKNSIYAKPALAPIIDWLDAEPPESPTILGVKNGNISWKAAVNWDVRSWTIYQQSGDTWMLVKILPAVTTAIMMEPGNYAVCAVDRMNNESAGVVVSVK